MIDDDFGLKSNRVIMGFNILAEFLFGFSSVRFFGVAVNAK
jgi:hypothetical protein